MIRTPIQFWTSDNSSNVRAPRAFEFAYREIRELSDFTHEQGSVWILEIDNPEIDFSGLNRQHTPVLLILMEKSKSLLLAGLNRLQPEAVHDSQDIQGINESLQKLVAQSMVRSKKRQSTRDLSHRYRELDELAANLEKIVEERTQWIEVSNREQKELIRLDRRFVQFLIEIGLQRSEEDVFEIFLHEFRQLRLADQVFLLQQRSNESLVTLFSYKGINTLSWPDTWWHSREIENLSENCGKLLSQQLARPIGRMIAFPLPSPLLASEGDSWALVIERSGKGALAESEFSLIKKYVQALGLTLEKMRLEDDSRLTALRWEKVFDQAHDPIAIIDKDFQLLRSNSQFEKSAEKKTCYQTFAGRNSPCEGCPRLKSNSLNTEVSIRGRSYQVFSSQVQGDSPLYLHHYVDVTEKHKQWVQFLQSEKLSSIGQIAEVLAHEIYNPLAGLQALVEILLSDSQLENQVRSDLIEIQKAALRAQKVIVNLQDFVSSEEKLTAITLDEIVDKTLPLLKTKWRYFRMTSDLSAHQRKIKVAPQLISQVIYNLIQNGCHAMKSGQTLYLSTKETNNSVILMVSDQGSGIAEEFRDSIFKPFFTTKPQGQGTGLGLSLSKQIVERFGGKLWFTTEVNKGTTFFMELPLEK